MSDSSALLFFGTPEDKKHLPRLKDCVGSATVFVVCEPVSTWTELLLYCKKRNINGIFSTSRWLLTRLLDAENNRKQPSLDNYSGSFFRKDGIEIVFINPLEHFITVPYGKFLAQRFISKLTAKEKWNAPIRFNWEVLTPTNADAIFNNYRTASLVSVDIETFKENLAIRCIGYTAVFLSNGTITTHSCVLPLDSSWALAWMRKFNWELQAPKITQNGKYDNSYLLRYNAPLYNWLFDTATMFHCWYSELPKDLGFLGSFFVREAMYWKDLADTNDLEQYYLYNCRDHWTTALVGIEWLLQAPAYAKDNYLLEFPLNYPCLLSELTGVKRDFTRLEQVRAAVQLRITRNVVALQKMVGMPLNANSPKQVGLLLRVLGCGDLDSTNEKDIKKAAYRHPLNARILDVILEIRGDRKLISTYLRTDEDITKTSPRGSKEFKGRILYALNPHGTDTGRLASREHHFWCGLQIQNVPRGEEVKSTIIADNSFRFGEVDLEQAESRDTAYISGDENLIAAVESPRDFHSVNASAFFGKPYEAIYCDETSKVIDKPLRDLSKRTNHGANYNMGENVLVDTMGTKLIEEARKLLVLSKSWTLKEIAGHLLGCFHRKYPDIKGTYYPWVIHQVITFKLLVGATGWTRYCFGRPDKNKTDLNALVAHCPQSLNAMTLNKAYMRVFYEIALAPDVQLSRNFKLLAQIHDSIFFMFRVGHEYLAVKVKECMEIPVTIKGADSKVRTFTVPAAIKCGKDGKGAIHWSETE
jgi:DNA polymerase I-like protein with 3'-5' exonuclease and polymerase domains